MNRSYKRINSSYILIDDNKKIHADTSVESVHADKTVQMVALMGFRYSLYHTQHDENLQINALENSNPDGLNPICPFGKIKKGTVVEEAALSLGSSKLNTFYKITMPMMAAGIISGAILSWITMISELSTAILLYTARTKTLTTEIYTQIIRGNYGIAASLSTILAVLTIVSLLIFNKVSGDSDLSM